MSSCPHSRRPIPKSQCHKTGLDVVSGMKYTFVINRLHRLQNLTKLFFLYGCVRSWLLAAAASATAHSAFMTGQGSCVWIHHVLQAKFGHVSE